MHTERFTRAASIATLALFFLALVMSNEGRAAPLAAGGDHTGEDHSSENHANETLIAIVLTDATLSGSNLRGSILDTAIAIRTDFSGTQLRDTRFVGATLTNAIFVGAQLRDADFTGAFAAGADFSGAVFRDTTMAGVNLDGAVFAGANANGADFSGASFLGADLTGITNVDPNAFSGAYYDLSTTLDPGFDTSQMVFVPEPRPIVYIVTGLLVFGLLPEAWRPTRTGPPALTARCRVAATATPAPASR
jgi:uncharacterized protein YjbI with pentapeptide repeats